MLLNDDEIKERIESPLNLLNRLKSSLTKVTKHSPPPIPAIPPSADQIIPDLEDKIANTTAKSKDMGIMISAMNELRERLPEVSKPETLANIAFSMSKVIATQNENKYGHSAISSQIIVYAPQVKTLDNFEIIDVQE